MGSATPSSRSGGSGRGAPSRSVKRRSNSSVASRAKPSSGHARRRASPRGARGLSVRSASTRPSARTARRYQPGASRAARVGEPGRRTSAAAGREDGRRIEPTRAGRRASHRLSSAIPCGGAGPRPSAARGDAAAPSVPRACRQSRRRRSRPGREEGAAPSRHSKGATPHEPKASSQPGHPPLIHETSAPARPSQ